MTRQLSPDTRIWVYQAERDLTDTELLDTQKYLENFCRDWTAHNQQLLAAAEILYKRFIILKVDETQTNASGCSIDKSVRALKDLGQNLGINLFNRMLVPYLEDGSIRTVDFNHVEQALEEKKIDASTEFFDLNVSTLQQLQDKFLVPLRQHWAYPKV